MGQAYKIDRINIITYKNNRKKLVGSLQCRYLAKSQIINCTAQAQLFRYVNFRGSRFKKVNFQDAVFIGCDFWGAIFNKCNFQNAKFQDCVFMASKFQDCNFAGTDFSFSIVVNTNLNECHNIDISSGVSIYQTYPTIDILPELEQALRILKNDRNLKKNKLLYISDKKYNMLNLFLLQKKYHKMLPILLTELAKKSTVKITTYKKLERTLNKIEKIVKI